MKKQEIVYRSIACRYIDGARRFTQLELSRELGLSLSTVNNSISNLNAINALRVNRRSFEVVSLERLLLYWATKRRMGKDVLYQTRLELPVREIEKSMPNEIAFTCYTAYRLLFKDAPADYSEVYAYATPQSLSEITARFRGREGPANLIIMKADENLESSIIGKTLTHSSVCKGQLFVDLWNLKSWYAKDFVDALEKRLGI